MIGATLFSGIGAPEVSTPQINWRWSAEIDPFASAVIAQRFPKQRNLGDVTKVDWKTVERTNVIVFGSPCQDFSVAGERAGMDGDRGGLALVSLDIIWNATPNMVRL